jgi:transcriptional regulator with XRE-family HTH domain
MFRLGRGIFQGMRHPSVDLSDAFACVVQKHRKAKNFSRAALAQEAGLHQTYIGLLERGQRSPNLDTANAIARALGLSLAKMIAESERIQKEH